MSVNVDASKLCQEDLCKISNVSAVEVEPFTLQCGGSTDVLKSFIVSYDFGADACNSMEATSSICAKAATVCSLAHLCVCVCVCVCVCTAVHRHCIITLYFYYHSWRADFQQFY